MGGLGLVLLMAFGSYLNPAKIWRPSLPRAKADREYERRITGERLSGRPAYYAEVSRDREGNAKDRKSIELGEKTCRSGIDMDL